MSSEDHEDGEEDLSPGRRHLSRPTTLSPNSSSIFLKRTKVLATSPSCPTFPGLLSLQVMLRYCAILFPTRSALRLTVYGTRPTPSPYATVHLKPFIGLPARLLSEYLFISFIYTTCLGSKPCITIPSRAICK
ncbi:hypothetical protein BKA70DRAFT_1431292 [Coprinopsis sp. MPI-PUGE-AT-0042]|nr:hypothetical protein BKA70DRAFT_1431292 [Coprinopsis sp. MPI-PUGE-AT-0042]